MGKDNRREIAVMKIAVTLKNLKNNNLEYDKEKFMFEIMNEYMVSRRTALEYLQMGIARFQAIKGDSFFDIPASETELKEILEAKPETEVKNETN